MKMLKQILIWLGLIVFLFGCTKEEFGDKELSNFEVTIASSTITNPNLKAILISDSQGNIYAEEIINFPRQRKVISCLTPKDEPIHVTFFLERDLLFSEDSPAVVKTYFNVQPNATFDGRFTRSREPERTEIKILGLDLISNNKLQIGSYRSETHGRRNRDSSYQFSNIPYYSEETPIIFLTENDQQFYHIPNDLNNLVLHKNDFKKVVYQDSFEIEKSFNLFSSFNNSYFQGRNQATGKIFPIYADWELNFKRVRLFTPSHIMLEDQHAILDFSHFFQIVDMDDIDEEFDGFCRNPNSDYELRTLPEIEGDYLFNDKYSFLGAKYFWHHKSFFNCSWSLEGLYKQDFSFLIPKISDELLKEIPALSGLESYNRPSGFNTNAYPPIFMEINEDVIRKNPLIMNDIDWLRFEKIKVCLF